VFLNLDDKSDNRSVLFHKRLREEKKGKIIYEKKSCNIYHDFDKNLLTDILVLNLSLFSPVQFLSPSL
jgi:hypothetical protein